MNHKTLFNLLLALGLILALGASSSLAQEATVQGEMGVQAAVGTAFTYQGRLTQGGAPVAGPCDFQFGLWDAAGGGAQVGSTLTKTGVALTNGYFDAVLDFGDGGLGTATFAGDARWLAIGVRCPAGSGSYTPLSGRVALNAAPYALSLRPGAVVAGDKSGFTVLTARNTTTGEFGAGLKAETNATKGTALIVESKSNSLQNTYGVYATTASRGGTAVYGESKYGGSSQDNAAYGGYFKANAYGDVGVYGESAWGQGGGVGVQGKSAAPYGYGVFGEATSTSDPLGVAEGSHGVYGKSASPYGHGVYGVTTNGSMDTSGVFGRGGYRGVWGQTRISDDYAVGVYGEATASSGKTYGVYGRTASASNEAAGVRGIATGASGQTYGVLGETYSEGANASGVKGLATGGSTNGVWGETRSVSSGSAAVFGFASAASGSAVAIWARNDGIGDLFRGYSSGNLRFKVTNNGDVFADGAYQSPAADFAELLSATAGLEPGDVLVIGSDGQLARSTEANASAVVGVYSTRPAFVGGSDEARNNADKIPLAIVGIVPVKASAENGPIRPGDLLTTSSTPGHAMSASPVDVADMKLYRTGTIIGKALTGLANGTGVIQMLVTLQ